MTVEKVPYTELDPDTKCRCGTLIKVNVAKRIKRRPLQCYRCWRGEEHARKASKPTRAPGAKPKKPRQKKGQAS